MAYNQTQSVYSQLKEKILNGDYKPSQNLIEKDLALQFDVSRVTIKKALLMLENENLVENIENRSTRVRSFDVEEIVQYLQVRIILEELCAKLTAPIISDEALERMRKDLQCMESLSAKGDLMGYSSKNVEFHKCVYDSCPNKIAIEMIWDIRNRISRYNFKTVLVKGRVEKSLEEHKLILLAYENHDADSAAAATVLHVDNLKKTLESNYKILFI